MVGEIESDLILIGAYGIRHSVTYRIRLYTATELVRLVSEAGFAEVECFGTFAGDPLSRDTRLVLRAS